MRVNTSPAFSRYGAVPGLGLLLGFFIGSIVFGQLYLRERGTSAELTAQVEIGAHALVLLQQAKERDAAIIDLLATRAALDDASMALDDRNFGLAAEHVLRAMSRIDRVEPSTIELDPGRLEAVQGQLAEIQVQVSEDPGGQKHQLQRVQVALAALTPM